MRHLGHPAPTNSSLDKPDGPKPNNYYLLFFFYPIK